MTLEEEYTRRSRVLDLALADLSKGEGHDDIAALREVYMDVWAWAERGGAWDWCIPWVAEKIRQGLDLPAWPVGRWGRVGGAAVAGVMPEHPLGYFMGHGGHVRHYALDHRIHRPVPGCLFAELTETGGRHAGFVAEVLDDGRVVTIEANISRSVVQRALRPDRLTFLSWSW